MDKEKKPFVPFTTEEKREFGKQFSPSEKMSYRKGQRNAYSHMANTAKRQSFFIGDNIRKDEDGVAPPTMPPIGTPPPDYAKPNRKTESAPKATPTPKPASGLTPNRTETSVVNGITHSTRVFEPPISKGR